MFSLVPSLLSAAGDESGFHIPSISEFFPEGFLFLGTPFEFNRIMMVRVIATIVLCLLFWIASRRVRLVPGRGQNIAEMALDFVRVQVAEDILGKEAGRKHLTLLTILFFTVFAMNITGVIPGLNIAGSSVIGLPLVLAIVSYIAFIVAGIRAHGTGGFLKETLFPPGVPWPVYVILTPIEFISTFILRPATLTIRLMVNMVSGHLLLVLCFAATHFLFFEASMALKGIGVLTLAAGLAFTLFEIFIAALQAYIFTLLSAVYISLSESSH